MLNAKLAINSMSSFSWSFLQELAFWDRIGAQNAGIMGHKLGPDAEANLQRLADAGIGISIYVSGGYNLADKASWQATRDGHFRAIDQMAAHGRPPIYFAPGRSVSFDWQSDIELLTEALTPALEYAQQKNVPFAIEPTPRSSASFIARLADAIPLAKHTGLKLIADYGNLWNEPNMLNTINHNLKHIALMQFCDVRINPSHLPIAEERCHVGAGSLPLAKWIKSTVDAGYDGLWDLEVVGYDFSDPIAPDALETGIRAASALLDSIGI